MVCGDLRVHLAHHYRLDGGQKFCDGRRRNTECRTQLQCRAYVPADHRARDDAKLPPKAPDKVPDLPTLKG